MYGRFSAYLNVYNDPEFLGPVLRAAAPYLDELVVVDGAYAWMAPYLEALGTRLDRSDDALYDALETSRIPYRVLTGTWADQIEKRKAGYSACSNRYAARLDADEVLFFRDDALAAFFSSGRGVAAVEMPDYPAPGWIAAPKTTLRYRLSSLVRGTARSRLPCQNFLFDRSKVEPDIHLNYLWIARDRDKLRRAGEKPFRVYPRPVAFNAHLTLWRGYPGSVHRAESYMLNHVLRHGVPWLPQLRGQPMQSLGALFAVVSPEAFREIVQAHRLGLHQMTSGEPPLTPAPLSAEQEATFSDCYRHLLDGRAVINRRLCDWSSLAPQLPIHIDVSDPGCAGVVAPDNTLLMEFDSEATSATAQLHQLVPRAPWWEHAKLDTAAHGRLVSVTIPPGDGISLRRQIEVRVRLKSSAPMGRFRVRADRPKVPDARKGSAHLPGAGLSLLAKP